MTIIEGLPTGPPPAALDRETQTTKLEWHRKTGKFSQQCELCGLVNFASNPGLLAGFFGTHQGVDGSDPSCPGLSS